MRPSDYLKRGWCQDVPAVDAAGVSVPSRDPAAVKWCMIGALSAVYSVTDDPWWQLRRVLRTLTRRSPGSFNDAEGRTQQECIDAMLAAEKVVLDD